MIELLFTFGMEHILIRVDGIRVTFSNTLFGAVESTIDHLKLNYRGVCEEFPDLEIRDDWREEAIKRFKAKISQLQTEDLRAEYIIQDLKKYGYVPKYKCKNGYRREKL